MRYIVLLMISFQLLPQQQGLNLKLIMNFIIVLISRGTMLNTKYAILPVID